MVMKINDKSHVHYLGVEGRKAKQEENTNGEEFGGQKKCDKVEDKLKERGVIKLTSMCTDAAFAQLTAQASQLWPMKGNTSWPA